MATVPNILLWIEAVNFSERRGIDVVDGHDFCKDFGWVKDNIPSQLFAVRGPNRISLENIVISKVHRLNKGWAWETTTPERFPEPPFLLTDDTQCRLTFIRRVSFDATKFAIEEIQYQFEEHSFAAVPVFGCGWFGVLHVDQGSHGFGQLTAFMRQAVKLAGAFEMKWAGEEQIFGRIIFPADSLPTATSDCGEG